MNEINNHNGWDDEEDRLCPWLDARNQAPLLKHVEEFLATKDIGIDLQRAQEMLILERTSHGVATSTVDQKFSGIWQEADVGDKFVYFHPGGGGPYLVVMTILERGLNPGEFLAEIKDYCGITEQPVVARRKMRQISYGVSEDGNVSEGTVSMQNFALSVGNRVLYIPRK